MSKSKPPKPKRKVIDLYAMRAGGGSKRPMLCKSNGKVAYPDAAKATRAAQEFARQGFAPAEPYLCPHSRTVHYHLTTID